MDFNQLSKIVKKKILDNELIEEVIIEDKSFLHKGHLLNNPKKYHLKLVIKSDKLKKEHKIKSNKIIYKTIDSEMKSYIHSIQILFI